MPTLDNIGVRARCSVWCYGGRQQQPITFVSGNFWHSPAKLCAATSANHFFVDVDVRQHQPIILVLFLSNNRKGPSAHSRPTRGAECGSSSSSPRSSQASALMSGNTSGLEALIVASVALVPAFAFCVPRACSLVDVPNVRVRHQRHPTIGCASNPHHPGISTCGFLVRRPVHPLLTSRGAKALWTGRGRQSEPAASQQ